MQEGHEGAGVFGPFFDHSIPHISMITSVSRRQMVGLCLLCSVLVGMPAQAQSSRTITKEAELDADGTVEVQVGVGSVRVTTWDRSSVRAAVKITGESRKEVEDVRVRMEGNARRVRLHTEGGSGGEGGLLALFGFGGPGGPESHYTLQVPATATLSVTSEQAPVEVRGLEGDVTVEGSSSPVHLRNVTGDITVATFSGSLEADGVRGEVTFATFSGDARVTLEPPLHGHEFASFSGNANIILPADASFDLRTDFGWGGGLRSDFPLPDSSAQSDGTVSIAGGGSMIAFESFSGDLHLQAE